MSTVPKTWNSLSRVEKFGNIGSEVHRASKDKEKYPGVAERAFGRALELIDATLKDMNELPELTELARARELFVDAWEGGREYESTLDAIDTYFFAFAVAAQKSKSRQ